MAGDGKIPPPVLWAQRNDRIFLTINLSDVKKDCTIELDENKLYFKGKGGPDSKEYEVTIEFFEPVSKEESKYSIKDRNIPMVLIKKTEGPYWDRLQKDKQKTHWIKTDFNKWKDEDDSDDEGKEKSLEDMMAEMGGFGGGGGGMPDVGEMGFPEGEEDEPDSDDDELPDLE